MRRIIPLSLIISLALLICAKREEKIAGEHGGKLVIGTTDLARTISPLSPSIFGSNEILDLLFMHLHRIDPETGTMKPELASSWEFSEDLTSITYYLRNDVTWWDGTPVTADDILYTYQKMRDPRTNYPYVSRLRFIREVEVLGPRTIRFTFDRVYADILTDSDIMAVPKHIHESVGAAFGENPVGNGPYKIKEWIRGSRLLLTYNDAYYRGRPPLDEIIIMNYLDIDDMVTDFAQGDLDVVMNITPTAARALEENENIAIDSRPGNSYIYIGWNLNNVNLADKDTRRALSMAIDETKILNEVFGGKGTIAVGPLPPASWGCNEHLTPIGYNLSQAQDILRAKGFEDRNRNRILDKNGRDVSLTIITNRENQERVNILERIASDLRTLGIRVRQRTLDAASFISAISEGDFDGFIMGWSVGEKIDPTAYWHSDSIKGRFNFVSYKNSTVDSLITVGVAMLNRKKAKEIWDAFQQIIYDDQPYTFLIVPDDISATYRRVKGTEKGVRIAGAYTYWIPEAERRVTVASIVPRLTPTRRVTTPAPPAETPVTPPEEVVAPERLLEATAPPDTAAAADTTADTLAAAPQPYRPAVVTQTKPRKQVQPRYPESARAVGASGQVIINAVVGIDGKVKDLSIYYSFGNPACEEAALAAARQWEFEPATRDGEPVEQAVRIPFTFQP
ncbi:MAG: TonB family protein [candidate division WOR-3 bacterium]|nr:MAG: TonB family protein [candidate division WOR-3 bacterium]